MKGLIVDEPWISSILSGEKTWEMRSSACRQSGPIALIRKGSGHVVGVAEIGQSLPPIESREEYAAAEPRHRIPPARQEQAFVGGWRTPWPIRAAKPLPTPVRYEHPAGAVIWVNLAEPVEAAVLAQLGGSSRVVRTEVGAAPISMAPRGSGAAQSNTSIAERAAAPAGAERLIRVTGGNIRNKHIYLPLDFFPEDALGGSNKQELAPRPIQATFSPGRTVTSDIDRSKRILRDRSAVGDFIVKAELQDGDAVRIVRTAPYSFEFSKA